MTGRRLEEEGCRGIRFKNVIYPVFSCMKKKLREYGLEASAGNSGRLEGKEIVAHFTWDGEDHLLIEVKEKPWNSTVGPPERKDEGFHARVSGKAPKGKISTIFTSNSKRLPPRCFLLKN